MDNEEKAQTQPKMEKYKIDFEKKYGIPWDEAERMSLDELYKIFFANQ